MGSWTWTYLNAEVDMRRWSFAVALTASIASCLSGPALAEDFALLIGVGTYDDESIPDLKAPQNDVSLMAEVVSGFGVARDNITLLATGINESITTFRPSGKPTRAAILQHLQDLSRNVGEGDQVTIYISSHGSSQPDQPEGTAGHDEADGFDEVILPSNAGKWDRRTGTVENGILDDEIGEYVDRIRQKGAAVWLIVDACHSGTALRGTMRMTGDLELKYVDPDKLGLPIDLQPDLKLQVPQATYYQPDSHGVSVSGNLTALYAVRPNELALAARWMRDDGEYLPYSVSLLTHAISNAVSRGEIASHRELAQSLRGTYAYVNASVLPQFEGEFNRSLTGGGWTPPNRFEVSLTRQGLILRAGQLDLIDTGTVMRVANGRYPDENALFQVDYISPTFASLSPLGEAKREIFEDSFGAYTAELVRLGGNNPIKVALDDAELDGMKADALVTALSELSDSGIEFGNLEDAQADIVVSSHGEDLRVGLTIKGAAIAGPGGQAPVKLPCADALQCKQGLKKVLADKARWLSGNPALEMALSTPQQAQFRFALTAEVQPAPDLGEECSNTAADRAETRVDLAALDGGGLRIGACERLWLQVRYEDNKALDITFLYRAADGSLSTLECDGDKDGKARLLAGDARTYCLSGDRLSGEAAQNVKGGSGIVLVAVEQSPSFPVRTYRFLTTKNTGPGRSVSGTPPRRGQRAVETLTAGADADAKIWPTLLFVPLKAVVE